MEDSKDYLEVSKLQDTGLVNFYFSGNEGRRVKDNSEKEMKIKDYNLQPYYPEQA